MSLFTGTSLHTFSQLKSSLKGYTHTSEWAKKTWTGLTSISGLYIWTDGTNIYYSQGSTQYVLNGSTWSQKTWSGLTSLWGNRVWTDGTNIYYSYDNTNYVLNGNTWSQKTWSGFTPSFGEFIWTDGTNIYYSMDSSTQYVLNGSTWSQKTWTGLTSLDGRSVWTDGTNIYYKTSHVLNGDTWKTKTWDMGDISALTADRLWTDGTNIYASFGTSHYVISGDAFVKKTWTGLTNFGGNYIWTDGTNIYYSYDGSNYVLDGSITNTDTKPVYLRKNGAWVKQNAYERQSILDFPSFTSNSVQTTGESLTCDVSCAVGDLVVVAIITRDTLNVSDGWNLLSTSEVNSTDTTNQRLSFAYKVATSTTESITVTQASSQRLYITLVAIKGATVVINNGYSYVNEATKTITVTKPRGLTLWGCSAPLWDSAAPYEQWGASNDAILIDLGTEVQSRLGVFIDRSKDEEVTFTSGTTGSGGTLIVGSLTIQGGESYTQEWAQISKGQ